MKPLATVLTGAALGFAFVGCTSSDGPQTGGLEATLSLDADASPDGVSGVNQHISTIQVVVDCQGAIDPVTGQPWPTEMFDVNVSTSEGNDPLDTKDTLGVFKKEGLPDDANCIVSLSATSDNGEMTCGGSGIATIDASQSPLNTQLFITVNCTTIARYGGVNVTGEFNQCAEYSQIIVSPVTQSAGNDIDVDIWCYDPDAEGDATPDLPVAGVQFLAPDGTSCGDVTVVTAGLPNTGVPAPGTPGNAGDCPSIEPPTDPANPTLELTATCALSNVACTIVVGISEDGFQDCVPDPVNNDNAFAVIPVYCQDPSACGGGGPCGPVVETMQGPVEGVEEDGIHVFRGVPYAAPPVGERRWKPPEPALERGRVFNASRRGNACVQELPFLGATGDEDCLVLNVAAPAGGENLPVMFWLHGGGFILGEGAQIDGGTLGDKIARETGVIVVTINYRVGAFGFLSHSTLTDESPNDASSNYGLMDQTAALEWVRDNIAGFGGDPNNVTIFGESAGGFSVCSHLTSPLSAGLFHKAIAQSGNCQRPWPSLAGAEAQGDTFAQKIGCDAASDVLACMRGKSQNEVLAAFPAGPNFGYADLEGTGASWWPVFDGYFLTGQSADLMASGNFNQVPVMLGFTSDEAQLFAWMTETDPINPIPITDENYDDFLAHFLNDDPVLVAQTRAQYPPAAYAAPAQALGAVTTDITFRCPGRDEAALLADHVTTYLYQFEYPDAAFQLDGIIPRPTYGLGAFHSADIQYVFGAPASIGVPDFGPGVDEDLWMAMMGYWARFAASGDPNGGGAPTWTPWTVGGDDHLVFDAMISPGTGAAATECVFWADKDYLFPQF